MRPVGRFDRFLVCDTAMRMPGRKGWRASLPRRTVMTSVQLLTDCDRYKDHTNSMVAGNAREEMLRVGVPLYSNW